MKRSTTGSWSGRSRSAGRRTPSVDVYLFPAVVGGGLGDIEEVLAAGRALARAGFRPTLLRLGGRPLPPSVDGPWSWPPIVRRTTLAAHAPAALTVSPSWGVSAAPSRPGALGRGGAWEEEARAIESAYGSDATVHVSLEEFARTLSSREEDRERLREGGVASRKLPRALAGSRRRGELAVLREAFRRFRAFDRPNVLHLYTTFRPDPRFGREYPEAVQTGPLWPGWSPPRRARAARRPRREWVWYASPASAELLAPELSRALEAVRPPIRLTVRTDRPWRWRPTSRSVTVVRGRMRADEWRRRFAEAELRIVTGSRTLLEAMELGGPFLYFNGMLGRGARRRRHRPEKLVAWLDLARRAGVSAPLRRDVADFARGRRVGEIVGRAAARSGPWARFPARLAPTGFRPPYDDARALVVAVARALAADPHGATGIVAGVRAGARGL